MNSLTLKKQTFLVTAEVSVAGVDYKISEDQIRYAVALELEHIDYLVLQTTIKKVKKQ